MQSCCSRICRSWHAHDESNQLRLHVWFGWSFMSHSDRLTSMLMNAGGAAGGWWDTVLKLWRGTAIRQRLDDPVEQTAVFGSGLSISRQRCGHHDADEGWIDNAHGLVRMLPQFTSIASKAAQPCISCKYRLQSPAFVAAARLWHRFSQSVAMRAPIRCGV